MRFDSSPEPEPEFHMAKMIWGGVWYAHVYIFAILFMCLSLYNVNSLIGLVLKAKHIKKRLIFMFANIMLWSFNLVTSLQLFIDPYGSNDKMKLKGVDFLAFGMKLPCLTCAFSFIYIALIETSKVKLYSRKLHNVKYFIAIVVVHFAVSLTVHLYLIQTQKHFQVVIFCLVFFLLFSLSISCLFLYNYCKIKRLIGGNTPHVPTVKFRSSPNIRKDNRLTLSTQLDTTDGTYKTLPTDLRPSSGNGIINEGLKNDEYKEEISVRNEIENDVSNQEEEKEIQLPDLVMETHVEVGNKTDDSTEESFGVVNYGADVEDGVEAEPMVDKNAEALDGQNTNDLYQGNNAVDNKTDNKDENGELFSDDKDGKLTVTTDSLQKDNADKSEEHLNIQHRYKTYLGRNQLKVTVLEVSSDHEISDSEFGLVQSLPNDPCHLLVPSDSNDIPLNVMDDKKSDGVSEVLCNGFITQTYASTDSKPTGDQPKPVITTNVIASLKEQNHTKKEPFGNVASNYALPHGGTAIKPNKNEARLSRKTPAFVDKSLNKLLKLVTVVTISSSLYCSAIIYYIIIVVTGNTHLQTDAWPWFIYQTVARIAELGMSATMSYLVRRSIFTCKSKSRTN